MIVKSSRRHEFLATIYALVLLPLILMYFFVHFETPSRSQLTATSQAFELLKSKLCDTFVRIFVDFQESRVACNVRAACRQMRFDMNRVGSAFVLRWTKNA